jgi:hypothetical protein
MDERSAANYKAFGSPASGFRRPAFGCPSLQSVISGRREPDAGSLLSPAFRMLVSNSALHDTSTFDPLRQPCRWPCFRAGNFVEK